MTNDKTNSLIVSLAILKLNWDVEGQKSYLDNFVPIIAECIRISDSDVVSVPEIRKTLQHNFGLTIPSNSIETLLRRVKRKGYIKVEQGIYKPIRDRLDRLNFRETQQSVLRMHDALVEHIQLYVKEHHTVHWDTTQAEKALAQFLADADLVTLLEWNATKRIDKRDSVRFLIGSFVQHLQETYSPALEYLETVVKGNMLANALFLTVPGKEQKKFRNTQLYFDAPFLLFLLGYAGPERQAPCQELMNLLENSGAELCCFQHTLDESKSILEGVGHGLSRGNAYGPSVDYFLSQSITSSDVFLFAGRLERDIQRLGIRIIEKPAYDREKYPYVIDETQLKQDLQENVKYRNEIAIDRDVEFIAAIMRLRRGRSSREIEDSRAIFITMNSALFRISRDFIQRETNDREVVPPALTDNLLTNLLWLKQPFAAPDLPRKRIIADCYAAVQPSSRLWEAYVQEVEKLKRDKNVSDDDYYLLKYSPEAKRALMEVTFGDETVFVQGRISEILQLTREKILQDKNQELEQVKREKDEIEQQWRYEQMQREMEIAKQKQRIRARAETFASFITKCIGVLLGIMIVTGSIFSFWFSSTFKQSLVVAMILLIFFIYSVVDLIWGKSLVSLMMSLEIFLTERMEKILRSLVV